MLATNNERVDEAILQAASVDYLDLWFITHVVEDVLGEAQEEPLIRKTALDAIERLIRAERLRVGDLRPPGEFEAWTLDPTTALERIDRELAALNRPLGVGDVAWFEVPE